MERIILTVGVIEDNDTAQKVHIQLRKDFEPVALVGAFMDVAKDSQDFAAVLFTVVATLIKEDGRYAGALLEGLAYLKRNKPQDEEKS